MIEIETFTLNILFSACKSPQLSAIQFLLCYMCNVVWIIWYWITNKTQTDIIFLILCTRVFDIVSIIYCKEKFFPWPLMRVKGLRSWQHLSPFIKATIDVYPLMCCDFSLCTQKSPSEHGSVEEAWKSFLVQELVMCLEIDILINFQEEAWMSSKSKSWFVSVF